MRKRVRRVPVKLDSKDIQKIPLPEIKAILRAADPLIMRGGRALLAKILKGSRAKDVIERELHQCPAYAYFSNLSVSEITARIDWLILNNYLRIEYDYRLPLLVYTDKGWEIERDTYSDELLSGFAEMMESCGGQYDMTYLKDRPRDLIFLLLDKVEASRDSRLIPLLEAWQQVDYRKVRERIDKVIRTIRSEKLDGSRSGDQSSD